MTTNSRKFGHYRCQFTAIVLTFITLSTFCGCQDWPDERVTALQAQGILSDLSKIETVPDANILVPEVYKSPPKKVKQIVGGKEEWKLFYFCRYHTSDNLKQIVHEQFATKIFDEEGKSATLPDYTVTSNPATNQLIVRCPAETDIDAVFELLRQVDVPPVQVRIDCLISELYADLTMDRETTIMIENLFGESVSLGGKMTEAGELLPAFPGAALRDPARANFGLKVGLWRHRGVTGREFRALVDLLVSRGYLKILMNPTLEVINGQTAKIQAKENVPLQEIYIRGSTGSDPWIEHRTEYVDVIDSLEITPHVFADGYIGLETTAKISAKLTPEGIKQQPIVTEREITNKDNRIRHGESLVIGGIRKAEQRDVIRGVPGLKDIPVLGLLFSSRDFEERAKEVMFIITPTISTGGIPNEEMVEKLRKKHEQPATKALHKAVIDTLSLSPNEERQNEKDKTDPDNQTENSSSTKPILSEQDKE